jgi:hypothetical protein
VELIAYVEFIKSLHGWSCGGEKISANGIDGDNEAVDLENPRLSGI